jgi:hypothetical protein
VQPSLSDDLFKPLTRSRRPPVKLSISGNETLDLDGLDVLLAGPDGQAARPTLTDGLIVHVALTGYVKRVGQEQTPKGDSVLVLALSVLGFDGVTVTGELFDPEAE